VCDVYLPVPGDFDGKVVDVYNGTAGTARVMCANGASVMAQGLYYNSSSGYYASQKASSLTVGASGHMKLHSYGGSWNKVEG
jgi:hypothetical protein